MGRRDETRLFRRNLWVAWQDWDNFHFRRQIDDKIVQDIAVVNHVPWKYQNQNGTFEKMQNHTELDTWNMECLGSNALSF